MLQYVLTHPDARAVGIDPWLVTTKLSGDIMEQVMSRALHNVSTAGKAWASLPGIEHVVYKGSLVRGNSAEVLRIMNSRGLLGISRNSVDLCMIDGNHNDYAAYDDAEQCLPLMKPGGWLLFDDVENQVTKKRHVKQGLEMFIKDYRDKVNFIWKDRYMECFEVL
jgi:predicted O-methyltransferase YrrM